MKKIYSSKFMSFMFVLLFIFQIIITLVTIMGISKSQNESTTTVFLIVFAINSCIISLILFFLNRAGCIIFYDKEKKELKRRGFIFGYKYTLKVSDITDIIVVTLPKNDEYFIIIDQTKSKIEYGFKESYICIIKDNNSIEFISQFYNIKEKI